MNENSSSHSTRRNPWVFIGVAASIAMFLGLMFLLTPGGFDMSHEQIGAGKPAVVFVHDPNLGVSITQSEEMNKARDQLNGQVVFLFATIGTPDGDQLITEHNAKPAELLFFGPSGELIKRQFAPISFNEIISWFG